MEEQQDCSNSDTKLSESWTLVSGDNSEPDNVNCEAEDSSDAESLEVLEVEQAEPNKNLEDNSGSEIPCNEVLDESNCIRERDIPVFHIVAAHKTKKYVHHPNPYINMWLSIMMVVAIAITLGLGMGHYLGTRRFSKATDIIQHLQCKNHILEMEFSKLASKHKICERNLHDTENIFNSLMTGSEIEYPVEEKIIEEDLSHLDDFHKLTSITPLQYEAGDNDFSFEKICFFNQNFSNSARMKDENLNNSANMKDQQFSNSEKMKDQNFGNSARIEDQNVSNTARMKDQNLSISARMKGDQTVNHILLSNTLRENSENMSTPIVNKSFAILKTKLSSLRSLLKKWSQYISNIYSESDGKCRENNDCSNATKYPQNTSCKSIYYVNNAKTNLENPFICFNTSAFTSSHNDCSRLQFNLRKRCEDELELKGERNKLSGSMLHFPSKENKPNVSRYFPEIVHKTNSYSFDSDYNKQKSKKENFKIYRDVTRKYKGALNFEKSKLSFEKIHGQIKRSNTGKVFHNGGMFQKHKFNCIKNGYRYKCSNQEFLQKQYKPKDKGDVTFSKTKKYFHSEYNKKDTNRLSKKYSKFSGHKEKKLKCKQDSETQYTFRQFNSESNMKQNKAKFKKRKHDHYDKNNFPFDKYAAHKIKKAMNYYGKFKDDNEKLMSHKDLKLVKRNKHLNKDIVYGSHGFSFNNNKNKNRNNENYLKYNSRISKKQKEILFRKGKTHYPYKQAMNAFKF